VCVCLSSGFKGQCFNYAIPIAKSYPPMTSLPYLGLVVLPLRTPWGLQEGFPTSPCILVGIPWQLLYRQSHNLGTRPIRSSSQFRGGGCSDLRRAKLCMAFGRSEIAFQRTEQECVGGAGIKYLSHMDEREGPTPCTRKRVHEFNMGLCMANGQTQERK
jgi:hypothetical protein